jgi:hypothetical protein
MLTHLSGTSGSSESFSGECCFQGIYFVCKISFLKLRESGWATLAETGWLTGAVKNICANRVFEHGFSDLDRIYRSERPEAKRRE